MSKWQPIETAPKDGTHILGLFDEGVIETWWRVNVRDDGSEYGHEWDAITLSSHGCGCCSWENDPPKAWMPLPEPPE